MNRRTSIALILMLSAGVARPAETEGALGVRCSVCGCALDAWTPARHRDEQHEGSTSTIWTCKACVRAEKPALRCSGCGKPWQPGDLFEGTCDFESYCDACAKQRAEHEFATRRCVRCNVGTAEYAGVWQLSKAWTCEPCVRAETAEVFARAKCVTDRALRGLTPTCREPVVVFEDGAPFCRFHTTWARFVEPSS